MFSTTPLLSCHLKSVVRTPTYLEVQVLTEHLAYQVIVQGEMIIINDRKTQDIVTTDDPMFEALKHFLARNRLKIRELLK